MFFCFKSLHFLDKPKLDHKDPRVERAVAAGCPVARISCQNGHLDRNAFGGTSCSPGMELKWRFQMVYGGE